MEHMNRSHCWGSILEDNWPDTFRWNSNTLLNNWCSHRANHHCKSDRSRHKEYNYIANYHSTQLLRSIPEDKQPNNGYWTIQLHSSKPRSLFDRHIVHIMVGSWGRCCYCWKCHQDSDRCIDRHRGETHRLRSNWGSWLKNCCKSDNFHHMASTGCRSWSFDLRPRWYIRLFQCIRSTLDRITADILFHWANNHPHKKDNFNYPDIGSMALCNFYTLDGHSNWWSDRYAKDIEYNRSDWRIYILIGNWCNSGYQYR